MPKQKQTVVSSMKFIINDKEIECKIEELDEAKEKYDDKMAEGNKTVVFSQTKKDADLGVQSISVMLGNLPPG